MAGSYGHIITQKGNLASNERVVSMLENGGDVFEAVEELYGMIWYLAGKTAEGGVNVPKATKTAVEEARQHYKEGLTQSRVVNRLYPGRGNR